MSYPALLLALLLPTLSAGAWQKEINTDRPGPHLKIRPVSLTYKMSWNGALNSGRANILFGRADKRYPNSFIAQGYGSSIGIAAGLFPYSFQYTSFLSKTDYTPRLFIAHEKDNRETIDTTNRYGKSFSSTETITPLKRGAPKTRKKTFAYTDHTVYDILSSILYIRSLPLKNGEKTVMVLFPFSSPYLARITVLGRELHNGRKCIKLDLKLNKIDHATLTLKGYKKMKSATMWVSDDAERLPIEFRVEAFIGDVRAVLDGYKYLE